MLSLAIAVLSALALTAVLWAAPYSGPVETKMPFCFPNPFTSRDTVSFVINPSVDGVAVIKIYSAAGLFVGYTIGMASGDGTPDVFLWDGRNFAGEWVGTGVYLYIITVTDMASGKEYRYTGKCYKY